MRARGRSHRASYRRAQRLRSTSGRIRVLRNGYVDEITPRQRRYRTAWPLWATVLAVVMACALFMVLYAQLPWWIDGSRLRRLAAGQQGGLLGNDRGDLLKTIAGVGALVALVYTVRKHALDRSGQVTDRYGKAISQIASDRLEERLGGIYALERIMVDSSRDQPAVVEVLAAFVRHRAARPKPEQPSVERKSLSNGLVGKALQQQVERIRARPNGPQPIRLRHPTADVAAAMTVLARRPRRAEPFELDLRNTDLAGLKLPEGGHLVGADFWGADLSNTGLKGVDLSGATLYDTVLTHALMIKVNLAGATLTKADLTRARLSDAVLTGAYLQGATLTGTLLDGADLTGALLDGVETYDRDDSGDDRVAAIRAYWRGAAAQLAGAFLNSETQFDVTSVESPWIQARLADCAAYKGKGSYFHMPPTPEPGVQ